MPQPTTFRPLTGALPSHLASEEAELYRQIVRAYGLKDEVSLKILEEACSSLQRARLSREAIERDGMTFLDDKGRPKGHPLLVTATRAQPPSPHSGN
jgi:hypothetical protein